MHVLRVRRRKLQGNSGETERSATRVLCFAQRERGVKKKGGEDTTKNQWEIDKRTNSGNERRGEEIEKERGNDIFQGLARKLLRSFSNIQSSKIPGYNAQVSFPPILSCLPRFYIL